MAKAVSKNPYESLKLGIIADAGDLIANNEFFLSKHPAETIRVLTAQSNGSWAFGYSVNWSNGKSSFRNPSKSMGVFSTERDALLYGIGYMKSYSSYFQADTVANINTAERMYVKPTLPL